MKKIVSVLLIFCLTGMLCACTKNEVSEEQPGSQVTEVEIIQDTMHVEKSEETQNTQLTEELTEELSDDQEDYIWGAFQALGQMQLEEGVDVVTITVPAQLMIIEVSQETLDAEAGKKYVSATINDDGSVTVKMTKVQHKYLLNELVEKIDESIADMEGSKDYSFKKIEHNEDYTQFDVSVTTQTLSFSDSMAVFALFVFGESYGVFSGQPNPDIKVNFYNNEGTFLYTADAASLFSN